MEHTESKAAESEPLEYFTLGRRIRRDLAACTQRAQEDECGDIFYLWLQVGSNEGPQQLTRDHWLNIVDEAASLGVNTLVITLGDSTSRAHVPDVCRWARQTHEMVVCLHAPDGKISGEEQELLREMPPDSGYLLVDLPLDSSFDAFEKEGIAVRQAAPETPVGGTPCDYPNRMIFVDAQGQLYTCGLVSGESEFFLGSVFDGSLGEIIHNPQLPHTVSTTQPAAHQSCSGCPPLVAKYLCHR